MTNTVNEYFDKLRQNVTAHKQKEQQMLEALADTVLDLYRVVLGNEFTPNGVIRASTQGHDVKCWDSIAPDIQNQLSGLCVSHPQSVDTEIVSVALSKDAVSQLRNQGLTISEEQAELFQPLINSMVTGLKGIGVQFDNGIEKARIHGLIPLVHRQAWLVSGESHSMSYGEYYAELTLTENAIKANQRALTTALVAADDIVLEYRMKFEKVKGIETAGIEDRYTSQGSPFVVTYVTKDGKPGQIDVLKGGSIRSQTEDNARNRLSKLIERKQIDTQYGLENLHYMQSIGALVGLPRDVTDELRANVWRNDLRLYGVNLAEAAEVVLVPSHNSNNVTFFYGTLDSHKKDNSVMVACTFDERYHTEGIFVCTRERMQKDINDANQVTELDPHNKPILDRMAVLDYVNDNRRLTQNRH